MTDLPKWAIELGEKARRTNFQPDFVGLLIDHVEELRAFVRDCDCGCNDINPLCERCRLLGEGGGDV